MDSGDGFPVTLLPNPGEGGPVDPGDGFPVIPLPNPGEGGPVDPGDGFPVIPLPNPGEGGPVDPGNWTPVIPLPNPGEGGPVGPGPVLRYATVRFLNASYGYRPFRVLVNNRTVVNSLGSASVTPYVRVLSGYQTISVVGRDGYIYIQKPLPLEANRMSTVAIINTASGLDLVQMTDTCPSAPNGSANFRVCNLAYNTRPLDILLGDGRVLYRDVRFKETTSFKRMRPGRYQLLVTETDLTPTPYAGGVDMDSSGSYLLEPVPIASLYMTLRRNGTYTAYLLSCGPSPDAVETLLVRCC